MIDPFVAGLAGAACVAVGARGIVLMRSPSVIERRELAAEAVERQPKRGPTRHLIDALGVRFGPRLLARMGDRRRGIVQARLDRAGRPGNMDLERYAEIKAATLVLAIVLAILLVLIGSWLSAALIVFAGWVGVDWWLARTGRRRQNELERQIPDFIDILSITVRSGTGYRAALARVAGALTGPPAEEVLYTLRQMELGATRREAFDGLRERNSSPTLDSFVAAQLQAEELGVPLADALASIAADTRRSAAQAARRRAQRTVPRVSLITAVVLLPATMILIGVGMVIGSGIHLGGAFG
ncbi:MAG: type II secretion system F family protein [Solirubrobacteraceae bacterium]